MRATAPLLLSIALLLGCPTRFDPPRLGLVVYAPRADGSRRYEHAASGVAFRLSGPVERGERIVEGGDYERISISTPESTTAPFHRVVILHPLDGSRVSGDAVNELADGLVLGQTVDRDVCRTEHGHPARFLAISRATEDGREGWFLVVSDETVLVLMELVGPREGSDLDTAPEAFFSSLELGVAVDTQ